MKSHRSSDLEPLDVTVERILPYGIFVRLPDGKRGYIRRRELGLDADTEPSEIVQEGERIQAVITKSEDADLHAELSRRATLKSPWPEFARRNHLGDVVHGKVRAWHPNGVFVRVEAGVNGFVPLSELAPWHIDKLDELLWLGDAIEAVITYMDVRTEKLTLSIKARMERRAQVTLIIERLAEQTISYPDIKIIQSQQLPPVTPFERDKIGPIVVIDDDDGIRTGLVQWLHQRGYDAYSMKSCQETLSSSQIPGKGVFVVDIHLSDGDGLELVQQLRAYGNRMPACIMSSPEWLLDRTEDIRAAKVVQVFEKPLDHDEIDRFFRDLAHERSIQPAWKILPRSKQTKADAKILNLARSDGPFPHRLKIALAKLTELARAEKGIIFFRDPVSQTISILADSETLPLSQTSLYALKESPVKDVIAENESVFEGHATENKRFDKLTNILAFKSCIGAPIEVKNEVHHALFFFHRKPDAFARVRPQYIDADVLWLGAILEEQALEQRLRIINPLILSGELAVSLAHEVYNKVDSLELQMSNLLFTNSPGDNLSSSLSILHRSILDLKTLVGSFQQMMRAKELPTTFSVNDVTRRAEMFLRPIAHKENVKINLHLADSLPYITGNPIALQQVFFNIMLNAVQQVALKPDKHRLMEITTSYNNDSERPSIIIRFTDTGPGIHTQLWEKIFELGLSMRGGSGLGLFIARSLIEMFDGKIQVEESAILIGTTFLVTLPVSNNTQQFALHEG